MKTTLRFATENIFAVDFPGVWIGQCAILDECDKAIDLIVVDKSGYILGHFWTQPLLLDNIVSFAIDDSQGSAEALQLAPSQTRDVLQLALNLQIRVISIGDPADSIFYQLWDPSVRNDRESDATLVVWRFLQSRLISMNKALECLLQFAETNSDARPNGRVLQLKIVYCINLLVRPRILSDVDHIFAGLLVFTWTFDRYAFERRIQIEQPQTTARGPTVVKDITSAWVPDERVSHSIMYCSFESDYTPKP